MSKEAPKVFISHASEDKDRFVRGFAEALRKKGVDAWFDEWEILPGDSIIKKIFLDGLDKADAVIAVVSKHSVNKPWVENELDVATVAKINRRLKLIPVIIDNVEAPPALKAVAWEQIGDINNYKNSLNRIVNAIFEHRPKPSIGEKPRYIGGSQPSVGTGSDLSDIDKTILRLACTRAIEQENEFIETSDIIDSIKNLDIADDLIEDSLEILEDKNLIECSKVLTGSRMPSGFRICVRGFQEFGTENIENYAHKIKEVGVAILNFNPDSDAKLMKHVDLPKMVVRHALDIFDNKGWIKIAEVSGDIRLIIEIRAGLRRYLA